MDHKVDSTQVDYKVDFTQVDHKVDSTQVDYKVDSTKMELSQVDITHLLVDPTKMDPLLLVVSSQVGKALNLVDISQVEPNKTLAAGQAICGLPCGAGHEQPGRGWQRRGRVGIVLKGMVQQQQGMVQQQQGMVR